MIDTLLLLLLGLVAGAGGGLLGIGGSIVMIPGLVMLRGGEGQHLYQAAAMIVNFFVVAPAVWRHRSARAIDAVVVRWTVPAAVVGAIGGVFISELPVFSGAGQGYLQCGFALFLVYALVGNLLRLRRGARMTQDDTLDGRIASPWKTVVLVGLPAGLVGGLLGVGGGIFAVPAQQVFLRIPLRRAIANSAATILASSVVGAAFKNAALADHGLAWVDSGLIAACLIPTAMLGAWVGASRVHRWPIGVIRVAFALLLGLCAVRMASTGWQQLHAKATLPTHRF